MKCDFYQTPIIQDSWIFKSKDDGFSVLWTIFWHEDVLKCYELR
jgi:hypothetical protein